MNSQKAFEVLKNCEEYFHTAEELEAFRVSLEALTTYDDLCENLAWYINERNRLLKTGKWILQDPEDAEDLPRLICSECGNEYMIGEDDIFDFRNDWKYCPNCGARVGNLPANGKQMKEGEEK